MGKKYHQLLSPFTLSAEPIHPTSSKCHNDIHCVEVEMGVPRMSSSMFIGCSIINQPAIGDPQFMETSLSGSVRCVGGRGMVKFRGSAVGTIQSAGSAGIPHHQGGMAMGNPNDGDWMGPPPSNIGTCFFILYIFIYMYVYIYCH